MACSKCKEKTKKTTQEALKKHIEKNKKVNQFIGGMSSNMLILLSRDLIVSFKTARSVLITESNCWT